VSDLERQLQAHVDSGALLGALGVVDRDGEQEVALVGRLRLADDVPLARDAVFRVASLTKPVLAVATMTLVDDGLLALDDEVRRWLPELEHPVVVRSPGSPVDDVVPARRPVTVHDVLTSTAGWGFADDGSLPAVQALGALHVDGSTPPTTPDDWTALLGRTPMLRHPGAAFLYNLAYDLLGVLLARVTGHDLPTLLAERVLDPLGMRDTGFSVPADQRHRLADCYHRDTDGHLVAEPLLAPGLAAVPSFPSGSGGLVSTADDLLALGRVLLHGGRCGGAQVLSPGAVTAITTNHLRPEQCADGSMFLDGQGWGYGGGVDTHVRDPWNVVGRYGWVGGTGTSSYVHPSTGTAAVLLTQRTIDGPDAVRHLEDAWTAAARPASS
jgi:CubicO group peptidase (beta-lactamase class C family)